MRAKYGNHRYIGYEARYGTTVSFANCSFIIAGDMFTEAAEVFDSEAWESRAFSVEKGRESRRRLLCAADYIIPGHGKQFQVTDRMRQTMRC